MPWYKNRRGESLWFADSGAGCPVMLVHGWCMSSSVWKYQYEGLAASYRLIAPDLRGHGRSRDVSGNLTFAGFAQDLVDLMESLDLTQVILVGWSMGAQIVLHAFAELSHRLAGIALVSATPRFTSAEDFPHALAGTEASGMRLKVQRNARRALDGFYTRLFADGELDNHASAAEIKELLSAISPPDTTAVLDGLEALAQADMRHLLAGITVPALIVNGSLDRICLPEASCYLKNHIADAEQVVFPLCGHAPFLTRSDQFNTEIIKFTRSISGKNV